MNKIWAPWRIKYITQTKTKKCLFCRILKEKKDKDNLILLRSSHSFAVLNKFPYNNGHLMIVPNRHLNTPSKLSHEEIIDMHALSCRAIKSLKKILKAHGFNTGMNIGSVAGAGIAEHIHMHIVPRWRQDTNFMPVLADTRVISQSLNELYPILQKEMKKNG